MFKSGKKTKAPLDFTTVSEGNPSQPRVTVTSICAGHSLGSQYGEGGQGDEGSADNDHPLSLSFILRAELEARDTE